MKCDRFNQHRTERKFLHFTHVERNLKMSSFWTAHKLGYKLFLLACQSGGLAFKKLAFVLILKILSNFNKIKSPPKKWQVQKLFCQLDSSMVKPISLLIKGEKWHKDWRIALWIIFNLTFLMIIIDLLEINSPLMAITKFMCKNTNQDLL